MLKEFLAQYRYIPKPNILKDRENISLQISIFSDLINFLSDSERFPNREINDVMTLMWGLIADRHTFITIDQGRRFPSISFATLGDALVKSPTVIIPVNFIDRVKDDTIMQLGSITYVASQARDYYSGELNMKDRDTANRRAMAFEAETFLTLAKMASEEGEVIKWNERQEVILSEYPRGLASLPQSLNYKTPQYAHQDFRKN